MAMKKKMKGNITSPALPGKSILAEVNITRRATSIIVCSLKTEKLNTINKYIALVNIRTTRITRFSVVMDDDEDIRILAEDIKRNGLMHNLVCNSLNSAKKEWYMFCFPANGGFVH